jgi:two-component system response regulator DesR
MTPIRVLIADDQQLVRGALAALLAMEEDIDVVGEAGRGDEVAGAVARLAPDVVLMDIEMPGGSGIEATRQLRAAGSRCAVVIVTTFGRPGYLQRALAAGVSGFVVKDTPPAQLAEAVRRVHAGLRVIDPSLAEQSLLARENPLTEREAEVCRAAAAGSGVKEIAAALHLSGGTVRNHLSSVIGKTSARNRHEAVRIAEENGWL